VFQYVYIRVCMVLLVHKVSARDYMSFHCRHLKVQLLNYRLQLVKVR